MKIALLAPLAVLAMTVPTACALAQGGQHNHGPAATSAAKAAPAEMVNGEVKRISKDGKGIVIAHGPIKSFDMGAMTMAFPVKDPALLGKVKAGDKIRFALEKAGEDLVITRIEPAR